MALEFWQRLAQMGTSGSRSSVLAPLNWIMAMLFAAYISAMAVVGAAPWLLIAAAVSIAPVLALQLISYYKCLIKNPDLLRSEHYNVTKLAIERQVLGDNLAGIREIAAPLLQAQTDDEPLSLIEGTPMPTKDGKS